MPLRVHGRYSRAEIEAAYCCAEASGYGILRDDAPWIHRKGVHWHEPSQRDLLFVTLIKSEALFSPTARYRDLALGPSLFHWESQSTTTAASPTGQVSPSRSGVWLRHLRGPCGGAADPRGVDAVDGVGGLAS
ncbi:hypothetical protein SYNGFB01_08495 [Synechococcus sp. GFB01]|nr:hypothetical protein SYNGFB01_08495 [Synechococcus sp. GFB01]